MWKECPYYKQVKPSRIALIVMSALSVVALPAASVELPSTVAWPVDAAWVSDFPVGAEFTLVLGDSRLFVVGPALISARAWADGAALWTRELDSTASPVADAGRLYVPTAGAVYALSEATGRDEWRLPIGRLSIAPTARAGWLIAASDAGTLNAINTLQGRMIWQVALPAPVTAPLMIDGDLILGACVDGRIRAWRITDGALRWTREIGARPTQMLTAVGDVFVASEDGRLISLRQQDGRMNWAYSYGMAIVGRLAADAHHVFVTTIDNSVHAHAFNGNRTWHQLLGTRVVDGLFADTGHVFVPQSNGEIRLFVADRGTRAGRLSAPRQDANVLGALVAAGSGNGLRMAMTTSGGSRLTVRAYRRPGLGTRPATSGPPGLPLGMSRPVGHP